MLLLSITMKARFDYSISMQWHVLSTWGCQAPSSTDSVPCCQQVVHSRTKYPTIGATDANRSTALPIISIGNLGSGVGTDTLRTASPRRNREGSQPPNTRTNRWSDESRLRTTLACDVHRIAAGQMSS